jgi:vacuolar-type H+-ATPase subunit H
MQQIVDQVLKAEEEAESILNAARAKAQELRSQAERELTEELNSARQEAQRLLQQGVAQAKQEAQKTRESALARTEEQNRDFFSKNSAKIDLAVERIMALLSTPEIGQE